MSEEVNIIYYLLCVVKDNQDYYVESGLYYCNTRYYDPSLCLWLTPDKIKFMDF